MPKTLLLADDSVTIQKVVGITFANEDVELVTVDNGTDALAKAKQVLPDLVLADVGMPGLDGYELCAAIRRYPELAHVPVLLLTGTFESYDEARARTVGASGHISKPFEAQALVDRVWALLAEAEAAHDATRVADPLAVTAAPAAAPPPPQPEPAPDPFADLPELPNSDFGGGRLAAAPGNPPRLPSPSASDLFDLTPSRPPLAAPLEAEDPQASSSSKTSRWSDSALFGPPGADPMGGETAFLDPLQDLTPALARPGAGSAALPPAEAPDFLDLGTLPPEDDTNPTYADGSNIQGEEVLDPRITSGESIAMIVPEMEVPAADEETAEAAPLDDLQPLPEIDLIDLEPLEPAAQDAVPPAPVRSSASAPDAETMPPLPAPPVLPVAPPPPAPAQMLPPPPAAPAQTLPPLPAAPAMPAPVAASAPLQAAAPTPAIDRDALHSALEKVAWEAFGSISHELVEQFTRRIESILWEVVPALTERLVREEIARLKGES
jgi:CheY-like chemotaxis protein